MWAIVFGGGRRSRPSLRPYSQLGHASPSPRGQWQQMQPADWARQVLVRRIDQWLQQAAARQQFSGNVDSPYRIRSYPGRDYSRLYVILDLDTRATEVAAAIKEHYGQRCLRHEFRPTSQCIVLAVA